MRQAIVVLAGLLMILLAPLSHAAENKLVWQVRKTKGIYGYLVYRSDQRQGPFLRINPVTVRTQVGADGEEAKFEFVDRDVVAGKTYYYFIDAVGTNARKQRLSGVMQKTVAAGE
jgi:hypothetical protein